MDPIDTGKRGMGTIRLALHIIVIGPDESSLDLTHTTRRCIVEGLY